MFERYPNQSIIIQKARLFLVETEAFVDRWGQLIVGDLENSEQAANDHVGQLFEFSFKIWLLKRLKDKVLQFCTKLNVFSKYQGIKSSINIKLG